jgi:hypothetical protein
MTESAGNGLLAAVVAVQRAAGTITKDKTATVRTDKGTYTYAYASLDTILDTLRPLLARNKLAWLTYPSRDEDGQPVLRYQLAHAPTGESLTGSMPLLLAKTDSQAMGSAITYARRYALCAVLNLVVDEDDDAQAASNPSGAQPAAAPPRRQTGASGGQRVYIKDLLDTHHVSRLELAGILDEWGLELSEGWMDKLTPGPNGTASRLIGMLQKLEAPQIDVVGEPPAA